METLIIATNSDRLNEKFDDGTFETITGTSKKLTQANPSIEIFEQEDKLVVLVLDSYNFRKDGEPFVGKLKMKIQRSRIIFFLKHYSVSSQGKKYEEYFSELGVQQVLSVYSIHEDYFENRKTAYLTLTEFPFLDFEKWWVNMLSFFPPPILAQKELFSKLIALEGFPPSPPSWLDEEGQELYTQLVAIPRKGALYDSQYLRLLEQIHKNMGL